MVNGQTALYSLDPFYDVKQREEQESQLNRSRRKQIRKIMEVDVNTKHPFRTSKKTSHGVYQSFQDLENIDRTEKDKRNLNDRICITDLLDSDDETEKINDQKIQSNDVQSRKRKRTDVDVQECATEDATKIPSEIDSWINLHEDEIQIFVDERMLLEIHFKTMNPCEIWGFNYTVNPSKKQKSK
jgi:hypothetical protein